MLVNVLNKVRKAKELVSNNESEVQHLLARLSKNIENLAHVRNAIPGDYIADLHDFLIDLNEELEEICDECRGLSEQKTGNWLKLMVTKSRNIVNAGKVRDRILKLKERVNDAQQDYMVNSLTSLTVGLQDLAFSHYRPRPVEVGSDSLLSGSGMGHFSLERERSLSFQKITLTLSLATKDEKVMIIRLKLQMLAPMMKESASLLYSDPGIKHYKLLPCDPFYETFSAPRFICRLEDPLAEIVRLLDLLQDQRPSPAVRFARVDCLSNSMRFLGLRAEALQLCMIGREVIHSNCQELQNVMAEHLLALSKCMLDAGRTTEALDAAEKVVKFYKMASRTTPGFYERKLASSLSRLAICLGAAGRRKDALVTIQDAVAIRRILVEKHLKASEAGLASSLVSLSVHLSEVGRKDEALAVNREAEVIFRHLALGSPEKFNQDLAMSLNNLSNRLGGVGKHAEALKAIEEAVTILRGLAKKYPDTFKPDLAGSLNNMSNHLNEVGHKGRALASIQESVDIYRELANINPDAFNPDLAMSLTNLSARLTSGLEDREGAFDAIQEAVQIRRGLSQRNPGAFDASLARSLYFLAKWYRDGENWAEALSVIEEPIRSYKALAEWFPAVYTINLADALDILCDSLRGVGRADEAIRIQEEARTAKILLHNKAL